MTASLLPNVGQERHEASSLDSRARSPLERCAVAASLAGKHLALVRAKLFEQADVFVVHISRAGATFARAKSTPILTIAAKLFPRHKPFFLKHLRTRSLPAGSSAQSDRWESLHQNGK